MHLFTFFEVLLKDLRKLPSPEDRIVLWNRFIDGESIPDVTTKEFLLDVVARLTGADLSGITKATALKSVIFE